MVYYNDDNDGGGGIVEDAARTTTTVAPTRMRPENVVRTPRSHIKVPPPPRARHAGRRRTSAVFGSAGRRK